MAWVYFQEEVFGNGADGWGYHNYRLELQTNLEGVVMLWMDYCDLVFLQNRITQDQRDRWVWQMHFPKQLKDVINRRKRYGYKGGVNMGNPAFKPKLTEQDVYDIKVLLVMDRYRLKDIAANYGVTPDYIYEIKAGKKRKRLRVPNDDHMKWAERLRRKQ